MKQVVALADQTVLVVDDDDINLKVTQELLEQIGFRSVYLAQSGKQALKYINTLPQVDAILVDVFMPDMDGIEFLGELAKLHFNGKVIVVSGVNVETLDLARQLGEGFGVNIVATMEKPLRTSHLAEALA